MTKDTNGKNTLSSSFRDQILRDLEELKVKRLENESVEEQSEITEVIPAPFGEEVVTDKESIKIDTLFFPSSYLTEVGTGSQGRDNAAGVVELTNATSALEENLVTTVRQDTVERNLEMLRHIVEANELAKTAVTDGETALEEEFAQANSVLQESTEDSVMKTEKMESLSMQETIIAPQAGLEETKKPVRQSHSRRSVSHRESKQRRKKQNTMAKRIATVVVSILVVAILTTGFVGYHWVKSSLEPVNIQATEVIPVEIPEGSSTLEIGKILVDKKLIKNATVFNYYAKIKNYNNFQSGFYNLSQSMSVDDIARSLQESGTPTVQKLPAGRILIVEGYTLAQIATAVTNNTLTEDTNDKTPFTAEQFMATVTNQDFINRMATTYPRLFASLPAADSGVLYQLEGYLFPAVYEYTEDTTMEGLVEQMISAMDARLQPHYDTIAAKNLTVNEVLTLASLVEKEGSTDEDRRNIASVFFNRINAGMPLQSNIAILYAQGKLGQETTLAEDAGIDTSIESPYNIYWTAGLMPGPVDSPSLSAIEAVINANTTDYLYFVADVTTGNVYYANNIDEHNQNVEKYVNAHLQ